MRSTFLSRQKTDSQNHYRIDPNVIWTIYKDSYSLRSDPNPIFVILRNEGQQRFYSSHDPLGLHYNMQRLFMYQILEQN